MAAHGHGDIARCASLPRSGLRKRMDRANAAYMKICDFLEHVHTPTQPENRFTMSMSDYFVG